MTLGVHFDDSLPMLASRISALFGKGALEQGVAVRDTSGALAFFLATNVDEAQLDAAGIDLCKHLGRYARRDRVLSGCEAPGARRVLTEAGACRVPYDAAGGTMRVLDRRIVGADWLVTPVQEVASPPRVVFSSLKGGVGRSTALSIFAADQAHEGRNVLVVDLDLESPGVGSMLLEDDRRPTLGALDFLADASLEEWSSEELDQMVGTSSLTAGAGGLVDVVPVNGRKGLEAPQNFLGKLSRAMTEAVNPAGELLGLQARMQNLVTRAASRRPYDVVLLDVRAGLAELTAGPLLGMGASLLLFGTDQRQTLEGYRYLFAYLSNLPGMNLTADWRARLKMVHAKAPASRDAGERFNDEIWEVFCDHIYDVQAADEDGLDSFTFDAGDPTAPHWPLTISASSSFAQWDPVQRPSDLLPLYYDGVFRDFISGVKRLAVLP